MTHGQWIGTAVDARGVEVNVIWNIEKRTPGVGQALNHLPTFPDIRTVTTINFGNFQDELVVTPAVSFFDLSTGKLIPAEEFWKIHNISEPLAKTTTYKFLTKGRVLSGSARSDTGTTAKFELTNTIHDPARKADLVLDWKSFNLRLIRNAGKNNRSLFTP